MKRFLKLALAAGVGVWVAESYVLPALNIPSSPGIGVDDAVVGATVATTVVLVDRLF